MILDHRAEISILCINKLTIYLPSGIKCPAPDDVLFASFALSVPDPFVNTVLTYVCNSGYEIKGASTLTCLPNGKWSDGAPTCTSENNIIVIN